MWMWISLHNLEGTLKDWEKILEKIKAIEKYDLKWWTKELKPIINEFIQTKKGKINLDSRRNFMRLRKGTYESTLSGITTIKDTNIIDGWIIKFFPYNAFGIKYKFDGINESKGIPSEIINCSISVNNYNFKLFSGIIGMSQDPITFCCKPEIAWYLKLDENQKIDF